MRNVCAIRTHRQRGAVMFEAAFILLIMINMIIGIMEISFSFVLASFLETGVSAAGRAAQMGKTETEQRQAALQTMTEVAKNCLVIEAPQYYASLGDYGTGTTTVATGNWALVEYRLSCHQTYYSPMMRAILPEGLTLEATTVLPREGL